MSTEHDTGLSPAEKQVFSTIPYFKTLKNAL